VIDPYTFPAVQLLDPVGTKIVLSEDPQQTDCCTLRVSPKHGQEPEAVLNRSTAILLRRALGLWIEYLDSLTIVEGDDIEE